MATRKPPKKKPPSRTTTTKKKKKKKPAPRASTKPVSSTARKSKPAAKPVSSTARRPTATSGKMLARAPLVWQWKGHGQAVGLHVDEREVWAGWDSGDVVAFDHQGEILRRWKLPDGVCALVADEVWRYAGCDDGNVYDLTGRAPRVAYEIDEFARVLWLDIFRGQLVAADSKGALSVFDVEQKLLFKHAPKGGVDDGWLARADSSGVYLGHSEGVVKLSWQGEPQWKTKTECVGFGVQNVDELIVFEGDWEEANVLRIDKATGAIKARGSCFSKAKEYHRAQNAASCAAGGEQLFGGTCDMLFAFDNAGALLWEAPTGVGAPCSMAFHEDRIYVATSSGFLACIDVSAAAIERARNDTASTTAAARSAVAVRKLSAMEDSARDVEDTTSEGGGVVVECVKEGSKVRVRVVSPGYQPDWFVQFPRDIREEGARYVVDEVREATQGGFYRVLGEIRRLRS